MSNPTTYYTVGGIDLSNIFFPYTSGPQAITTGYKVRVNSIGGEITNVDLNQIFTPINSPPIPQTVTPVPATNFYTTQGNLNFNILYSQTYNSSEANTFATSNTFNNIYYSFTANKITYSTNYGTDWYTSAIQNPPSTTIMRRTICNNDGNFVTVIVDASTYDTNPPYHPTSINVVLYQSTDFAKNWLPLDLSTNETWTNISMNGNGDTIYACSSFTESPSGTINSFGSVYVSNNYGESWEDITPVKNQYKYLSVSTSSNSDITLASFFINNTQPSGIYKYTNNTWSIIDNVPHNTNPNFSDYSWEFIKISSDGNTFLIASTTFNNNASAFISIICLSVNSGSSWSTIYTSSEYLVTSLAMSPDSNNMYYAISYYMSPYSAFIYKSTDNGASFNQFYTKSPLASIRYMSVDNNNKLYFLQTYFSSGSNKLEIVNYSNVYDLSKIFLPLDYNNQDISIFDSNGNSVSVNILSAPDGVTKYIILSNYNNTTYSILVNYSPSINLSYLMAGGGGTGGNGVYNLQTFETALWCCSSGGGGGSGEIIYSNQTTTLPTGQSNISFTVSTSGGTKGTGYITYNVNNIITCTVNSGGRGGNGILNKTPGINPPTSATGGSGGIGASGGGGVGDITYYPGVNGAPGEANPPTGAISQSTNPALFANGGNGATSSIPGNTFTFGGKTIQIGLGGNGAYRAPDFTTTFSTPGIISGGSGGGAGVTLAVGNLADIIYGSSGPAPYILLYWTKN